MQRRSFIKSMAAAASAPLMPANMLSANPLGVGTYAKAVGLTKSSACLSTKFLKSSLGLDEAGFQTLVNRLQIDGLVGQAGNSGLLFSKNCFPKHVSLAFPTAQVLDKQAPSPKAETKITKATNGSNHGHRDGLKGKRDLFHEDFEDLSLEDQESLYDPSDLIEDKPIGALDSDGSQTETDQSTLHD